MFMYDEQESVKSSSVYKELGSLPVLQSAAGLYSRTKQSSWLLNTPLTVIEYSCTSVLDSIYNGSRAVSKMDSIAGEGMAKLKHSYPVLNKTPEEIQVDTSQMMKSKIRHVMKTTPGQVAIRGLDWAIGKSDRILKSLKPRDQSPRKRKTTRSTVHKPVKEHNYASEDSGACDADSKHTHKSQQTLMTAMKKKEDEMSLINRAYNLGLVFPLEVLVILMKSLRRYVGGKKRKSVMTPEKESEIGLRRKMSPRKKVTTTIWGQLKFQVSKLVGYGGRRTIRLDSSGKPGEPLSPGGEDTEKKRKHDEILTDQGSDDSETEDLRNFDFDNYDSEQDSDYKPSDDSDSDLSDDISDDGDSESDLEAETVEARPDLATPFVQLKDKDESVKAKKRQEREKLMKDIKQLGESKDITNGTQSKDDKQPEFMSPKLSLQPQWKKEK